MARKLNDKEIRHRKVSKVVLKIRKLEKFHTEDIVKSACYKYNIAIQNRKSAEADLRDAEERIADAKRRLK